MDKYNISDYLENNAPTLKNHISFSMSPFINVGTYNYSIKSHYGSSIYYFKRGINLYH